MKRICFIPARLESSRFPGKPLFKINGKPMIQTVVENINIDARHIFIVQKKHYEQYHLKNLLSAIAPNCEIIQVDGMTEGAACTTLLAKELINSEEPLLMANSDQFVEWDSNEFMYSMISASSSIPNTMSLLPILWLLV